MLQSGMFADGNKKLLPETGLTGVLMIQAELRAVCQDLESCESRLMGRWTSLGNPGSRLTETEMTSDWGTLCVTMEKRWE